MQKEEGMQRKEHRASLENTELVIYSGMGRGGEAGPLKYSLWDTNKQAYRHNQNWKEELQHWKKSF